MVLATKRRRGGSLEEGVRQQLIKVLWAEYSPPPPTQVIKINASAASPNQVFNNTKVDGEDKVIKINAY